MAWWQSGYAEDCKSLYAGSIPTQASKFQKATMSLFFLCFLRFLYLKNGTKVFNLTKETLIKI